MKNLSFVFVIIFIIGILFIDSSGQQNKQDKFTLANLHTYIGETQYEAQTFFGKPDNVFSEEKKTVMLYILGTKTTPMIVKLSFQNTSRLISRVEIEETYISKQEYEGKVAYIQGFLLGTGYIRNAALKQWIWQEGGDNLFTAIEVKASNSDNNVRYFIRTEINVFQIDIK